jgi:hypothetical protein
MERIKKEKREANHMANQEHLDIFKQGAEVWNKWKEEYPDIVPDLSGIDVRGIDMHRTNLQHVLISITPTFAKQSFTTHISLERCL